MRLKIETEVDSGYASANRSETSSCRDQRRILNGHLIIDRFGNEEPPCGCYFANICDVAGQKSEGQYPIVR